MGLRFAALGRTRMLLDAIDVSVAAGHQLVLVGTCAAAAEYGVDADDFRAAAERSGAAFFDDAAINSPRYVELARDARADVAISVNWLTLIGAEMLSAFPHGIVNAHAGDLPRYRGNAVPNWALLAGEPKIVLTLHQMAEELDAGAILLQRELAVDETTYIGQVYDFLSHAVPEMFVEVLDGLEAGTVTPRPQSADPRLPLRCYPRRPQDSLIDWSRPADDVAALVRASGAPFAGAYTWFDGPDGALRRLVVWRARPADPPHDVVAVPGQLARIDSGRWAVVCGDMRLLALEEVTIDGQPPARGSLTTRTLLGVDVLAKVADLQRRLARLEEPGRHA